MSYRCEATGKVIGPGIRQFRVVTEKREKQYPVEVKRGPNRGEVNMVIGWEIVKEVIVGPEAYEEMTGEKATNIYGTKDHAVSQNALLKESTRSEEQPWRKRKNKNFKGRPRRPQVEKVQRFKKREK